MNPQEELIRSLFVQVMEQAENAVIDQHPNEPTEGVNEDLTATLVPQAKEQVIHIIERVASSLANQVINEKEELKRQAGQSAEADDSTNVNELSQEVREAIREQGFTLGEQLGKGAMGVVHKARQPRMDREVAIKTVQRGIGAEAVRRLLDEIKIMSRLTHPNIVRVYEAYEVGDVLFYAMDLIKGNDLSSWRNQNPCQPQEAARLVQRLAEAVLFAHQQGVIHRDIKPSNVLIDKQHNPHLTDFGIARLFEVDHTSDDSPEAVSSVMGTPAYAAPEQCRGKEVSTQADIYSLGATLYFLLMGEDPFSGMTIQQIVKLKQDGSSSPAVERANIPRDLQIICKKCTESLPQDRYQSVTELIDDLQRFQQYRPLRSDTWSLTHRARLFARRRPMLTLLMVLSLLALTGFFIARSMRANQIREQVQPILANAHYHWARREESQALAELTRAQEIASAWPAQDDLTTQIQQLREQWNEPAIALQKLRQFNRKHGDIQASLADILNEKGNFQRSSDFLKNCEEALSLYGVMSNPDWQTQPHVSLLSESERQQLLDGSETLLATYFGHRHFAHIRGSAMTQLGFQLADETKPEHNFYVFKKIAPNSSAAKAGIQKGDKLLRVDGVFASSFKDANELRIKLNDANGPVRIQLLPKGGNKVREVSLTLSKEKGAGVDFIKLGQLSILGINKGSEAARVGIREGDLVLSINGQSPQGELPAIVKEPLTTYSFPTVSGILQGIEKQSIPLVILRPSDGSVHEIDLPWSEEHSRRQTRANVFRLTEEALLMRGSVQFQLKKEMKDWNDPALINQELTSYFRAMQWPLSIIKQALNESHFRYPLFNQAINLTHQQDMKQASALFQEHLLDHPQHADSYRMLGFLMSQQQKWEASILAWSAFLSLRPTDAQGYFWRAKGFEKQGRILGAIRDIQTCLKLNPKFRGAKEELERLKKLQES